MCSTAYVPLMDAWKIAFSWVGPSKIIDVYVNFEHLQDYMFWKFTHFLNDKQGRK